MLAELLSVLSNLTILTKAIVKHCFTIAYYNKYMYMGLCHLVSFVLHYFSKAPQGCCKLAEFCNSRIFMHFTVYV